MKFFDAKTGDELLITYNELWRYDIISAWQNQYDNDIDFTLSEKDPKRYTICDDFVVFRNGAVVYNGKYQSNDEFYVKKRWIPRDELVYRAFTGSHYRTDLYVINHIDGDYGNCCIDNLELEKVAKQE